jgi:archaellum component FlaC
MGPLRAILAKFGFDIDDRKLDDAKKKTDDFATRLKDLANKVVGGDLNGTIKDWIGEVKEAAGEFKGLAKMTGTSAEDMQRWTTAAKLSGSSVEALSQGFRVLMRNASQASGGGAAGFEDMGDGALEAVLSGKKAQEMFKALGVEVKDANGRVKTATQLMGDVGLELAKIKDPAQRAALATKLFGRQGAMLLPMFAEGEAGLQKFLDRIDELGGGVSEDALEALKANSKATKEYELVTLSLKSAVVAELLPALTSKIKLLTQVWSWVIKTQKGTQILKSGMMVLTGAILYTQRP